MKTISRDPGPFRLTLRWRRTLVLAAAGAAAVLTLLYLLTPVPTGLRYGLSVPLSLAILGSLWLLADCVWPWIGGDLVDAEDRAHADSAVRRAYTALFAIAVGVLLYLQAADSRPELRPEAPHHAVVILWCFVALVVLLPVGIFAWSERGEGDHTSGVGPLGLVRSRFTGPSAPLHWGGVVSLLAATPLLVVGSGAVGSGRGLLAHGALVIAVAGVAGGVVVFVRAILAEHRQGDHGHRS